MPFPPIPAPWRRVLAAETRQPYFRELEAFVDGEREEADVYPPAPDVFAALALTPPARVRVLILGQDPYPSPGMAHGLSFSVRPGVRLPASLRNIFAEMRTDLGVPAPASGSLVPWAERGVLLLNAVLTVRARAPNSHRGQGWERFTDAIIGAVNARAARVVFVLWGAYAGKKRALLDETRHAVVASAHPSPLSARAGFFGSRPFSRTNALLEEAGEAPIDWRLPDAPAAPARRRARA